MIRMMLVDDDSAKIKTVTSVICRINSEFEDNIKIILDSKDAVKELQINQFDLLILDINLPQKISENPNPHGGLDLLELIESQPKLKKPHYIIGLTAYDDAFSEYADQFYNKGWRLLRYNASENSWQEELSSIITSLNVFKTNLTTATTLIQDTGYDYDIAFVTATDTEFEQLASCFDSCSELMLQTDSVMYMQTQARLGGSDRKIIFAKQHQMGMSAAATLSMKMIVNFRPKLLCMVGIAGGIKEELHSGDIIVVEDTWDYGSGKIKSNDENCLIFEAEPNHIPIDVHIKEKFTVNQSDILIAVSNEWVGAGKSLPHSLQYYSGALVSGASVVANKDFVNKNIYPQHRKIFGIDMETYGVYFAARNSIKPKPRYISVKSVSDFADAAKDDSAQVYAAFTSSRFLLKLLDKYPDIIDF